MTIAFAVGLGILTRPSQDDGSVSLATTFISYLSGDTQTITLDDPANHFLKPRDPVLVQNSDGSTRQAGYVSRVNGHQTTVLWYDQATDASDFRFVAEKNDARLDDVFAMMFPPEKRRRIEAMIASAMATHGEQLSQNLLPIFEQSMRRSVPAIEVGFRASVARHRGEIDRLTNRWNDEIVAELLVPMAKKEIVPLVRKNGEPVAELIGRELWERASIWGFTWRALYDRTPLPRKDLMKQEWDRFVEEEAIPVVESHAGDIAAAVQQTLVEIAANENVRAEVTAAAEAISRDPEARMLVQTLLREAVVENETLRAVWAEAWTSDEARAAIALASRALEPTIRAIGDEMMGTREKGIDPAFAKLLRNQVLQKDQRWVRAVPIR